MGSSTRETHWFRKSWVKFRLMLAQICSLATLVYPHKISWHVPVSKWRQNSKRMTWEYGHKTLVQLLLHWKAGWKSSRAPEEWWSPHLSGCKSHSFKILKSQGLQHEVLEELLPCLPSPPVLVYVNYTKFRCGFTINREIVHNSNITSSVSG